ncbi:MULTISPECIES: azurin [unclassified Pseudomonas]|uniref:azurin n=1 Tax=unclassified Pseudomonas TaxID=196821 RepID=UPI000BDCD3C9|nr:MULTISPECIES: azurin [unclassified Pseudomonas]PVZ09710.1 azurin [Pseudomonas sp. URIL14HWK12:I12]PVZ21534.1 azurin [Pseudomonas sp. URIL14HWK12:I10]PVZ30285.1 azurin [Pseudomonas sp. URIL14HWK12:I11]SNZ18582.1 azurin [Pseudomonas sp. URIL14HWK12:I9]
MFSKAALFTTLTVLSASAMAAECDVTVDSTDSMTFSTQQISISKSCSTFTVNLTHSGSLPKQVMGHNWVLSKASDMEAIGQDGMSAGLDSDYLKPGDDRVIAHTKMIGAGEKASVSFDVSKLKAGESYTFFCSYPAHMFQMKGDIKLVD